jgi:hypothetical protein
MCECLDRGEEGFWLDDCCAEEWRDLLAGRKIAVPVDTLKEWVEALGDCGHGRDGPVVDSSCPLCVMMAAMKKVMGAHYVG